MGRLGTRAALGVVTVVAAALAPGAAAADRSEPANQLVTLQATCAEHGRVVVRSEQRDDHTHVTVDGHRVANRNWSGTYSIDSGVDDTEDVALDFRSRDRRFHHEFDVPEVGRVGILDLERDQPQECFAAFSEQPRYTVVHGTGMRALVRFRGPELVTVWGSLDCRIGSRWRFEMSVGFDEQAFGYGFGTGERRCERGWIEFHRRTAINTDDVLRPISIHLRAAGAEGQLRRVSYRSR